MKIYIDLVLFLNFAVDVILLLSVSVILRRNANINRIIFSSFVGSLSILTLFFEIDSLTLFIFKLLISILMILIAFGYKNIKFFIKNMTFLYFSSILLGGFLYMLNIQFSYKNTGLIFYHNGLSINFIVLMILSPLIIYLYIKECRNLKNNYNNYYKIDIYYKNHINTINSFLDTGNKLLSPYNRKPVILVNKKIIKNIDDNYIYIPYSGVSSGLIKCIKAEKVLIEGIGEKKNVLVGLIDSIKIDGVDCILNTKLLEEK